MNFFRRVIIMLALAGALLLPAVSLAQGDQYGLGTAAGRAGLKKSLASQDTIPGVVGAVIKAGLALVGIIFFGLTMYAGVTWMIARGNTERVERAKEALEAAAIGLILVLSAYAITNFIFEKLGQNATVNAPAPEAAAPGGGGPILDPVIICQNGVKDGDETDVDCGGVCARTQKKFCPDGKECNIKDDCSGNSDCKNGICKM